MLVTSITWPVLVIKLPPLLSLRLLDLAVLLLATCACLDDGNAGKVLVSACVTGLPTPSPTQVGQNHCPRGISGKTGTKQVV